MTSCDVIDRGQKVFVEVGQALLEIREGRLYRKTHKTFDNYLAERWPEFGRARAYQLMDGAGVVKNLSTIVDILPANEAQARPLTRLEPADQPAAWRQAVDTAPNGRVTAAHVEQVVNQFVAPAAQPMPPHQWKMFVLIPNARPASVHLCQAVMQDKAT